MELKIVFLVLINIVNVLPNNSPAITWPCHLENKVSLNFISNLIVFI